MKIVVCDDQLLVAESLAGRLEAAGHEIVASVSDPRELAPIVRDRHVDACVLDVSHASDDRLQHIPELRRLAPWMRIAVLSGRSQAYRAVAMEAGATAFLSKSCTLDELLTALGREHGHDAAPRAASAAPPRRPPRATA